MIKKNKQSILANISMNSKRIVLIRHGKSETCGSAS